MSEEEEVDEGVSTTRPTKAEENFLFVKSFANIKVVGLKISLTRARDVCGAATPPPAPNVPGKWSSQCVSRLCK